MAVFEKKIKVTINIEKVYQSLKHRYLRDIYMTCFGLDSSKLRGVIDDDIVLKELAEYILNKEREVK